MLIVIWVHYMIFQIKVENLNAYLLLQKLDHTWQSAAELKALLHWIVYLFGHWRIVYKLFQ